MHFEYQHQQRQDLNAAVDLDLVVRNRGGGVPCVNGRNNLMAEPPMAATSTAASAGASAPALGSTDHQHQMRLLVLRERLRRALYN
ncbi:hypothetical protein ACLKA7_005827 [Drosophila subpalustris]